MWIPPEVRTMISSTGSSPVNGLCEAEVCSYSAVAEMVIGDKDESTSLCLSPTLVAIMDYSLTLLTSVGLEGNATRSR